RRIRGHRRRWRRGARCLRNRRSSTDPGPGGATCVRYGESPSGTSRGGGLRVGSGAARLQHQVHAEDAQQLQQPVGADLVGVALEGGERLLRDAQSRGELALSQPGLFTEGLEQGRQLVGGSDGVLAHGTHPELYSVETAYRLLTQKTQQELCFPN